MSITGVTSRLRARTIVSGVGCPWVALGLTSALLAQGAAAPRVPPVPDAQRSEAQQTIAAEFAPSGMVNLVGTYLQYPALGQRLLAHMRYLANESTLPPRHRELLALRTAWLARSGYLWAHRAAAARRTGLTADEITRVARGPDTAGWDPFEASLIRAADELHVDSIIADETWAALSARYDTNQMIDTIDTVGGFTMNAGVLNSLGVAIEPGMTDRLPSQIPYTPAAKRTNVRLLGRQPRIPPVEARGGRGGANVFRTFVRNPPADRVRGAINTHVNSSSTLTPRHRELLLIRIGVLCRSEYEFAAHARVGRKIGITEADLAGIIAGRSADPVERALLRAADELYEDDAVSAETWTALAATFDTRQMFDVLIAVGAYRSTSLLINSAGVQLDADMEGFRFPPALR